MIQQLKEIDNRASRAFEVWLENILEGYITEFAVDRVKSYNDVKGNSSKYQEVGFYYLCNCGLKCSSLKRVY